MRLEDSENACGGTLWEKVSTRDYDLYSWGRLLPLRRDVAWCVAPTRTPVACVNSSLEMLLCLCSNYGHETRIANLLRHAHLDETDIHPSARADCYLQLGDRDGLASVLVRSQEARAYVMSLNPAHVAPEITEWAQEFCMVLKNRDEAEFASLEASAAVQDDLREEER